MHAMIETEDMQACPAAQKMPQSALMKCSQGVSCAGMHRPVYTDSIYGNMLSGDVGVTQDLRAALERLFFQYEVRHPRACAPACLSGANPLRDSTIGSAVPVCAVRKPRGGGCTHRNSRVLQACELLWCDACRWMRRGMAMCTSTPGPALSSRCAARRSSLFTCRLLLANKTVISLSGVTTRLT